MKKLCLGILFLLSAAVLDSAGQSTASDWSALFPEVSGCAREIRPLTRNGAVFEQLAVYKQETGLLSCGTVLLRSAPGARRAAADNFKKLPFSPLRRKTRIHDFDAYSSVPLCGNDVSMGATTVYFDEDKSLFVNANRGSNNLWSFLQTADYAALKRLMDELVKK